MFCQNTTSNITPRLKYSQLASARTTARGKKREPGIPKGSERATDGRGDLFERFERATDCVPHSQESSSSIWTRLGLAGVNIWKLSWLKCPRRRMRSGSFRFICHFPPPIGTRTLCWVANTTHTQPSSLSLKPSTRVTRVGVTVGWAGNSANAVSATAPPPS